MAAVGGKWLIIFATTAMRETESKYFASLSDNFFYVFGIKLHSLQEEFSATFNRSFEKFFAAGLNESKSRFWFSYGNANIAKIFIVLIFLIGGSDVLDGTLPVGQFLLRVRNQI